MAVRTVNSISIFHSASNPPPLATFYRRRIHQVTPRLLQEFSVSLFLVRSRRFSLTRDIEAILYRVSWRVCWKNLRIYAGAEEFVRVGFQASASVSVGLQIGDEVEVRVEEAHPRDDVLSLKEVMQMT